MEEEKKNVPVDAKSRKHRSKRHGYFIEPPAQKAENTAGAAKNQDASATVAERPKKDSGKQNAQGKHQKNNDSKQGVSANNQEQMQSPQAGGSEAPKKNNKKRKKNKQRAGSNNPIPAAAMGNASENKTNQKKQETQKGASQGKKNSQFEKGSKPERVAVNHNADDYETYDWFVSDEPKTASADLTDDDRNAPKTEVVGVRFKSTGKTYYFDPKGKTFAKGSGAIVDTARGQEYGEVSMANSLVKTEDIVPPLRHVIRAATPADVEHHKENKKKEDEAFRVCNEKIAEHKLEMKLIDAQYTFDNTKLLFYFTSSERVDFRELVKDLASVFRTRIELRQIGIRDEAKIMGGLGMCGRSLCCTLFLSDFNQVSIKMAKEQNLSLNSAKISGICGRLMCCLKYEHEAYEYEIKRTPPVDSLVRTENGDGVVTEISPLAGTVKVKLLASPDAPPKVYKRDEIKMLRKKQNG